MPESSIDHAFQNCKRCQQRLPRTTRYFYMARQKRKGWEKLRIVCKVCLGGSYTLRSEYQPPLTRICKSCEHPFPNTADFFFKTSRPRKDGSRTMMASCKPCTVKNSRHRVTRWRAQHREQYLAHATGWKKAHRVQSNAWESAYRKANPAIALRRNLSAVMGRAIRQQTHGMTWEMVLGYTLRELMHHLDTLFQPGMTWENYGKKGWHIDHIRPRRSFSFTSIVDVAFLECWALSNLQPLWAKDNLSKGAKLL